MALELLHSLVKTQEQFQIKLVKDNQTLHLVRLEEEVSFNQEALSRIRDNLLALELLNLDKE